MESIKQSLIVDYGESEVRVPAVGERVRLVGERGEFMVMRVDGKTHTAELIRMTGVRRIESGVPLYALRAMEEPRASEEKRETGLPPSELQMQE